MPAPIDRLAMTIRASARDLNSDSRHDRERAMTAILAAVERYADNRYPADEVQARREAALADAYQRPQLSDQERTTR